MGLEVFDSFDYLEEEDFYDSNVPTKMEVSNPSDGNKRRVTFASKLSYFEKVRASYITSNVPHSNHD